MDARKHVPPSQPATLAAAEVRPAAAPAAGNNRPLNGVLLLVPVLAVVALAGLSLVAAAGFSIGFWAAFGWTTLAVAGALLLALAVAILRGK